jgi:hypothetical protein
MNKSRVLPFDLSFCVGCSNSEVKATESFCVVGISFLVKFHICLLMSILMHFARTWKAVKFVFILCKWGPLVCIMKIACCKLDYS